MWKLQSPLYCIPCSKKQKLSWFVLGVWDKYCLLVYDISTFSKCRKMVFIPNTPTKRCYSPTSIIQISRSSTVACLGPVFHEYLLVTFCVCGKIWVINIHIFIIPTLKYRYNLALSPRIRIIEVWLDFCSTYMLFLRYSIMGTVF